MKGGGHGFPIEEQAGMVGTREAMETPGGREVAQRASARGEDASEGQIESITTCLTFNDQAEEAIRFYVSVFRNSEVVSLVHSEWDGPVPKGKVLHATFRLEGLEFTALDGGPYFSFAQGMSIAVTCTTQEEIDRLWEALSEGGKKGPCGWLVDRFGVSWQIVPVALGEMMAEPAEGNVERVMEELFKMHKIDIETLRRAYAEGGGTSPPPAST